jgi:sugar phosphate isomerase/epimerase
MKSPGWRIFEFSTQRRQALAATRTGGSGIGFRRGWSDWQKDLPALCAWAKTNGFAAIDVGADAKAAQAVVDSGLAVGSVDLADWQALISPDAGERDAAVAKNAELVRACAAVGATRFFCVMLPKDPGRKRAENFGFMVEGFGALCAAMDEAGAKLVVEGWPGPGALCCTPENFRRFFAEVVSPAAGINFDPSHLIRMGIDPLRFLEEFATRVHHVHGKDTEIYAERQYELGTEQPATFTPGFGFGGTFWRYTIPGQGIMRWRRAFEVLAGAGYEGFVSIELEDMNFNGSEDGEKEGLLLGRRYLEGC